MREIKFRAWDKNKQSMRDVTGINWYDEYLWVDETPMSGDKLPIETTQIMQYTGLEDKNGKEIYEGDIVKITPDENQTTANRPYDEGLQFGDSATVEWNEVNMRWSLKPKGEYEEKDMDYYGAWSGWNWLEVIGNICENSELLK